MKKLKLSLSAIAVFAVVGSALAFTKPYTDTYCCRPISAGPGACTGETPDRAQSTGTPNCYGYKKVTNCNATCNVAIRIVVN